MQSVTYGSSGSTRYFVHKIALLYKMPKLEKGDNSEKCTLNFAKS